LPAAGGLDDDPPVVQRAMRILHSAGLSHFGAQPPECFRALVVDGTSREACEVFTKQFPTL
jgi:hypothetical protein